MNSNTNKDERDNELKVLHIAPTPFFSDRGCHIRIQGIISALQRKSVHNVLCTYHQGREVPGIITRRVSHIPGYTKQEAGPSGYKYLADILLFLKVCSTIFTYRPDIIHGHLHEGALLGWAAKTLFFWRKIPLVFDMQGSLVGELEAHGHFKKSGFRRKLFKTCETIISRLPDYTLCSSTQSMNIMLSEFNVPRDRVRLASDGVDITYTDTSMLQETGQQPDINANRPTIIYTGALLEAKGLGMLQQMMRGAKKRFPEVHFLIVGYPVEKMQAFVEDNELQDSCTLTGRIPFNELGKYLTQAIAAIEPKAEDSGEASGKLLNYMGAGLPVICFDTPNNREILGDIGYFAPCGSASGLVDLIEKIISDPDEAAKRGALGNACVQKQYSWDATADTVIEVYRKVLTSKAS